MHSLPGITRHGRSFSLPISDMDLIDLLDVLSTDETTARCRKWLGLLRSSPTLTVWCQYHFPQSRKFGELAAELSREHASLLQRFESAPSCADVPVVSEPWLNAFAVYGRALERAAFSSASPVPHLVSATAPGGIYPSPTLAPKTAKKPPNGSPSSSQTLRLVGLLETLLKPFVVGPLDEIKLWLGELFADFEFDLAPHEITQIEPLTDDLIAQRIHSWRDVASRPERPVLGPIAKKLSQANREAAEWNSEKLASLRQLAYGASHEINNPLANIATRAQLLIAGEKDDSRRKQLATIYRQAMRAHEMICDMMLFAHPPQPSFEPIELNRVVREAYQEFDTLARQSGGSIALEIADDVIELQADPGQIITMLNAIVQNAFESRAGSHVSIRCGLPDRQYAIILISDNGPGVSPETARHMFDPFYSGREAGRGLGFGLSKAWTIARLHGGDIRVQASDANGTIMRIELPIQHRS